MRVKTKAWPDKRPKKLVAFDMDGTLLAGTPSWELIHQHFGTLAVAEQAHRDYSEHRISYPQFMRRDLSAWPRPLMKSEIIEALGGYTIRSEAPAALGDLRVMGYELAIVSSALDLIVKNVAKRLGIKYVVANKLGFDPKGEFNGKLYPLVEPLRKDRSLMWLTHRLGVRLGDTVAVGDSRYDSSFLKAAGKGFVIGDPALAAELGLPYITRLDEIAVRLGGL